ncbi:MAG: hypothetical protein E6767_06240 [Dysgonomonas sp.]|nr:hypothetical protein [Dysgonomonas sp.]
MIKKSLLFLVLCSLSLIVYAQSEVYIGEGDKAHSSGQYQEAIKKYRAALTIMANNNVSKGSEKYVSIEKKIYKAEENQKLFNSAEAKFKAGTEQGYRNAKSTWQQLLQINKTDAVAQRRIRDCDARLASISEGKVDKALWDSVYMARNKTAFEYYLAQYPNGVYEKEAKKEIDLINEDILWEEIKAEDTLDKYLDYLSSSKYLKYKGEADVAICRKNDDLYWKNLSQSGKMDEIREYATKFSDGGCKQYVNEALLILKQEQYKRYYDLSESHYKNKLYRKAIAQYDEIKRHVPLLESAQIIYDDCKAEATYESIKKSKHVGDWVNFVEQYPTSRHYPEIANKLALKYAEQLNAYSTDDDYNKILSLASDSKTIKTVKEKIAKNKKKNKKK